MPLCVIACAHVTEPQNFVVDVDQRGPSLRIARVARYRQRHHHILPFLLWREAKLVEIVGYIVGKQVDMLAGERRRVQ